MNARFWRGKVVLVTGHTGFKGTWLSLWLEALGAKVAGFALPPPTKPSLFELTGLKQRVTSIQGDVRDPERLDDVMRRVRPAVVFHLAAQSLVRASYSDPLTTFATNVMGTANLLEAVRRARSVRVVVNVTSDKCYENREWPWGYRELEAMGGFDPYSCSKGCAELVTSAYRRSFFAASGTKRGVARIASARAGNVIGGGDWAKDRLIPDCMRALAKRRPIVIRNPDAIRPWQHVLEPLRGYLMLAERLWTEGHDYADGWNFGPRDEDAKPVRWIVDRLVRLWGAGSSWKLDGKTHPHEAHWLKLDCSKARARLGWTPVLDIERSLEWTVDFQRRLHGGERAADIALAQIDAYARLT